MSADGSDLRVREATAGEITGVMRILDAAMLSVSTDRVRSLAASGTIRASVAGVKPVLRIYSSPSR